jgi:hypothetical protein
MITARTSIDSSDKANPEEKESSKSPSYNLWLFSLLSSCLFRFEENSMDVKVFRKEEVVPADKFTYAMHGNLPEEIWIDVSSIRAEPNTVTV